MATRKLFLAGTWSDGVGASPVRSPFDGSVVAEVARAGAAERVRAAEAAHAAADRVAALAAHERVRILETARAHLQRRSRRYERAHRPARRPSPSPWRASRRRAASTRWPRPPVSPRAPRSRRIDLSGYAVGRGPARAWCGACPWGRSSRSRPFNFPLNLVAHKVAPASPPAVRSW